MSFDLMASGKSGGGGGGGIIIPQDIKVEDGKLIIDWKTPTGKIYTTKTDFPDMTSRTDKFYKGYLTLEEMYALDDSEFTGGEFCFTHSVEYGIYMYEYVVEGSRREWAQDATANWISRKQLEEDGIVLKSYATREPRAGDFIFKSIGDTIKVFDWDSLGKQWIESGEISHSFHADFFYANRTDGGYRQVNDSGSNVNVHKIATTSNSQMYGDPRSDNVFIGTAKDLILVRDAVTMEMDITDRTSQKRTIPLETFATFNFTVRDHYLGLSRAIRPTQLSFYIDALKDKDGKAINESWLWFSITDITNPDNPKLIFETSSITGLPLKIGKKINVGRTDIDINILNYLLVNNTYQMKMCCLATQEISGEIVENNFVPKSSFKFHIVCEDKVYNTGNKNKLESDIGIIKNGKGNKYLSDNGEYKEITGDVSKDYVDSKDEALRCYIEALRISHNELCKKVDSYHKENSLLINDNYEIDVSENKFDFNRKSLDGTWNTIGTLE